MAMVSGRRSTLNLNAPLFVPAAVKQVEDFSPEWWQLVTTSTWYHDYWISQHQGPHGFYDNGENEVDVADLLPESFDFDDMEDFFDADASQYDHGLDGQIYPSEFELGKNGEIVNKSNGKWSPKAYVEPLSMRRSQRNGETRGLRLRGTFTSLVEDEEEEVN